MDTAPIIVAIAVVIAIGGLIIVLLRRSVRDARAVPPVDADEPLSTLDERFRLLSFQGGAQPADLGPMLEELRRNGIEIEEETLRSKLAERASATDEEPDTTGER